MASAQAGLSSDAATDLSRIPEWVEFTAEEQQQVLAELQELSVEVDEDIGGLKSLLSSQFDISTTIQELKHRIVEEGRDRRKPPEPTPGNKAEPRPRRALKVPAKIASTEELDQLIQRLQDLRNDAPHYEFDVEIGEE